MERRINHNLPKQIAGKQVEILRERHFNYAQEALSAFAECRKKLLDINNWRNIAGEISSTFLLLDKFERETKHTPGRRAQAGQHTFAASLTVSSGNRKK